MRGTTQRLRVVAAVIAVLAIGAGCSGARLVDPAADVGYLPVLGSASDDLVGTATLPPPVVRRATEDARTQAAHFVRTADEAVPPSWSTPAPVQAPYGASAAGMPAPPPPPVYAGGSSTPTVRYASPTAPCAAPAPAVSLSQRCWSGCGLPCESGVSMWHARLVGGWPLYAGTETPDGCSYWGVDLGRTHCGCWGYDLYYRMSGAKFDRQGYPDGVTRDGGLTNHLGLKLTWERSISSSRFYFWTGLGAGYYWTSDYLDDSDGIEVFGEAGLGYVFNKTFRARVGLNVHGADTETGRLSPADAGQSRWLWLIAPVAELEIDF